MDEKKYKHPPRRNVIFKWTPEDDALRAKPAPAAGCAPRRTSFDHEDADHYRRRLILGSTRRNSGS